MAQSKKLTSHDEIKAWAKKHGGRPSMVESTEDSGKGPGILRFDFGKKEDSLEEIDWDRFFDAFDKQKLALLIDDSGKNPNFNKFVHRD